MRCSENTFKVQNYASNNNYHFGALVYMCIVQFTHINLILDAIVISTKDKTIKAKKHCTVVGGST